MSADVMLSAEQILRNDLVESFRLELKASWDPDTTGNQVLKTIAAFANDFQKLLELFFSFGSYIFVLLREIKLYIKVIISFAAH